MPSLSASFFVTVQRRRSDRERGDVSRSCQQGRQGMRRTGIGREFPLTAPYGTKEPTVTVRRFFHISAWTSTPCTLAVTVTHPSFYRSTVSRPAVGQARRCHCSLVLPFYRIAPVAPTPQTLNFSQDNWGLARGSRDQILFFRFRQNSSFGLQTRFWI